MTLEEAIERYENLSRECEERIVPKENFGNMPWVDKCNQDNKRCAEEYRQLAEWLKKLKRLQEKDRYHNWDVCLGGFHKD